MDGHLLLSVIGSVASVISLIVVLFSPANQKKIATLALAVFTVIAVYGWIEYLHDPITRSKIYAEAGIVDVGDFLRMLSQGILQVTMDANTAEDLKHRHARIKVPVLKNVSLKYALDRVLIPQLPGPEQWTYEVEGKTVTIRRRSPQ